MTNDEMVEKVAKAICCDGKCEAPRVCDCSIGIFRDSARAAIAVVVDECAKVARAYEDNDSAFCSTDAGKEGFRAACRELDFAIRALGAAK